MATVVEPPVARKQETKQEGPQLISRGVRARPLFDPEILKRAIKESFVKLNPRMVIKNPVMFVVEVGAALTTVFVIKDAITGVGGVLFGVQIALWLWFTVVFANFAEAMAEARGKAQAETLRATKKETTYRRIRDDREEIVSSSALRKGDVIVVHEGEIIPGDGEVLDGVAYVNEAAITGESAPVLKERGTDIRSSVTGGTQMVSDSLRIRISADPGETFLDRMIG